MLLQHGAKDPPRETTRVCLHHLLLKKELMLRLQGYQSHWSLLLPCVQLEVINALVTSIDQEQQRKELLSHLLLASCAGGRNDIDMAAVILLLEHGADINIRSEVGLPCLAPPDLEMSTFVFRTRNAFAIHQRPH